MARLSGGRAMELIREPRLGQSTAHEMCDYTHPDGKRTSKLTLSSTITNIGAAWEPETPIPVQVDCRSISGPGPLPNAARHAIPYNLFSGKAPLLEASS